jgi:hypothetical protein
MQNALRVARFTAITLIFACAPSAFAIWVIEPVDLTNNAGYNVNLSIDSTGRPQAGYYYNGDFRHSVRGTSGWSSPTTIVDGLAFALDRNDNTYFAAYTGSSFDLEFQYRQPSGFTLGRIVETNAISENASLFFDSQNRPLIAYVDTVSQRLELSRWNGTSWSNSIVASGARWQYGNSDFIAALDSQDRIHFAWGGFTDALQYAKPNGSTWTIQNVNSETNSYPDDIAFDASGNPVMTFERISGTNIGSYYATTNGTNWTAQKINGITNFVRNESQILFDAQGTPHLILFDSVFAGDTFLKHLTRSGSTWTSETITNWNPEVNGPAAVTAVRDARGFHVLYADDFENANYAFLSTAVPGDYTGNGTVGPEDYSSWRTGFGNSSAYNDGNGDGVVNAVDYVIWRNNTQSGTGQSTAVPEVLSPLAIMLLAATFCSTRSATDMMQRRLV